MSYDFKSLSPADFEDLVRDLVGLHLGMQFESFAPGPDDGIDGRHSKGGEDTILQAKHYVGSPFSSLKAAMKKERASVRKLAPSRYIIATSRGLTPQNKRALADILRPIHIQEKDIVGASQLNGLLREFPNVEKAHIKLWLSSAAVLERVMHAAAYAVSKITREEIDAKVRVYAHNPSFPQSKEILEQHHVLIISGPPGVGKTTLAEMLAYAYVGEGWELVSIRSLDDGFSSIVDTRKQIFFFDDFLGKIALDRAALASKESDLARFIKRTRSSPNARFILTTRAYIFEEARRVSEHLADKRLNISKYVLDVGLYTRRIRARILYNHLIVSGTPQEHIRALILSQKIPKIVDHKNYNPRIVEWMTDVFHVRAIAAEDYPEAFLNALANPTQLWDTAFRTHISEKCRHLLYALFFSSEFGISIDELKLNYQKLHKHLSEHFGHSHDVKDFEDSLQILEGGFITLRGDSVNFVNPSVRDYLSDYLSDISLLTEFVVGSVRVDWAQQLWFHAKAKASGPEERANFAKAFLSLAKQILHLPTMKKKDANTWYYVDLGYAQRIDLLLSWWQSSGEIEFANAVIELAESGRFSSWRDGEKLISLLQEIQYGGHSDFPYCESLGELIRKRLQEILSSGIGLEELERISMAIGRLDNDEIGKDLREAAEKAIQYEFENIETSAGEADSTSTLRDYITYMEQLAQWSNLDPAELQAAVKTVKKRIAEIEDSSETADSPAFTGSTKKEGEKFDDQAIINLFQGLLKH